MSEPGFQIPQRDPSWGGFGPVLLGMGAVLALLMATGLALAAMTFAFDVDRNGLVFRYGVLVLSQVVLVLVPLSIVVLFKAPWSSLGFSGMSGRGYLESFLIGAGLVGFTGVYSQLLEWWAPPLYQKLMDEQARQLELLTAPLPLLVLAAVVLAPVAEEVFFRGFIFGGLKNSIGFSGAAIFSSLLFALVHMMWASSPPLFLVGLGAAIQYGRYRSLAAPLTLHIAFNSIALIIESM